MTPKATMTTMTMRILVTMMIMTTMMTMATMATLRKLEVVLKQFGGYMRKLEFVQMVNYSLSL